MRATEIILELYQTVQTLKVPGKNKFVFKTPNTPKTPNGMVYTISLKRDFDTKHNSRLVISFTTIDPTTGKETNGRTNTGDAISIFRTVQSTLLDYLKSLPQDQLPDMLEFSAEAADAGRVSLYKRIAHSNRIPGYEFKAFGQLGPSSIYFTMKRTKQVTEGVAENFADGRNPEDKGDSARHGIPKGATMAQLERASHAKGRKGQLARWQLNMRRGKKK
jgi:hypothetical protein